MPTEVSISLEDIRYWMSIKGGIMRNMKKRIIVAILAVAGISALSGTGVALKTQLASVATTTQAPAPTQTDPAQVTPTVTATDPAPAPAPTVDPNVQAKTDLNNQITAARLAADTTDSNVRCIDRYIDTYENADYTNTSALLVSTPYLSQMLTPTSNPDGTKTYPIFDGSCGRINMVQR